ncbi:MAG: biotin transporter BioY [Puniceicoccales bacterium]|jgi:biotin transport system substrate-specific component|nr:biotin transporter BioY [Puniceicoccales bacterium]
MKVGKGVVAGGVFSATSEVFVVVCCSLIMLVSSYVRVPFYPVPFTMQTFVVVAVSIFAGRGRALRSLLLFTLIRSPFRMTGGYILGFFAVPLIIGDGALKFSDRRLLARIFCSHLAVLAMGTAVLVCFAGSPFISGFLFFVPAEIFKGLLSFALVRAAGKFRKYVER